MRTLHVDTGREMQGGQWQVIYLLERLPEAILLARKDSPLFAEAKRREIDVRPLSFLELRSLAQKVELVHAHDSRAHTFAAIAGGAPLVVSRRVAFPMKRGFFSDSKYAAVKMYLAVSKCVAMRLHERGLKWPKIRVVYDGVPIPEPTRPERRRVVALKSKPVKIPGISVDLTENLWEDLRTAAVFVYQSELEGLGSAALAAMAAGVPVVASAVGGLPEIIEHEHTGLLVSDGNFEVPVRCLLEKPAWAEEMGRAARECVMRDFSVEKMIENTTRVYGEVLGC